MGKIFDALEKSKKEDNIVAAVDEPLDNIAQDKAKIQEDPFKKNAMHKKASKFLRKKANALKKGKPEKEVAADAREEMLYQDNNIDRKLISFFKPQSFEAEQFKMLRTNLFFPVSGTAPRSMIVTSAIPSEGKSFVAANLSISIAHSLNEHVLLIDCDLRNPSIHKQFGFKDPPGLSEHLSNGNPLSSLFLRTGIKKLSILPGGKTPHNPAELLSSQQMSDLLEEFKNRYNDRYLVIDSPPPELTAETRAILRMVDGALLVVEYGYTPRKIISDLVKKIGKDKILGVVFNKCDMRISKYYGYGKYRKYNVYYDGSE